MTKVGDYANNQEPLKDGVYRLNLLEMDPSQKTTKGDRMVLLKWTERETGSQIWDRIVVSESAAWRMAQLWVALGGSEEDEVGELPQFAQDLMAMVQDKSTVCAKVYTDEYQGKQRNKIAEYITDENAAVLMDLPKESPF